MKLIMSANGQTCKLKGNEYIYMVMKCPTLMLSISYEFGEICKICHYVK